MELHDGLAGMVYRNTRNGSYYVFEQLVRGGQSARIWPLEVFPNRMLIKKPMPTNVQVDTPVTQIGPWRPGMKIRQAPPEREAFELELVRLYKTLRYHNERYELLPFGGRGPLSRGSYRNKITNVERRIKTLMVGLDLMQDDKPRCCSLKYRPNQWVRLPSGAPVKVLRFVLVGGRVYAVVKPKNAASFEVPEEILSEHGLSCLDAAPTGKVAAWAFPTNKLQTAA